MCIALSGCSASSVLPGLIGSKPDITAQAGAENVKQTVGVTAKQDTSSKQETTFKESAVGKVDTSNKKQVSTSSIKADNITAERIEIRNNDGLNVPAIAMAVLMFIAGMLAGWTLKRNKAA
ncbi:Rz-like spanin [Salmonella phage 36]|uniref:Putative bdr repeat protein n=1 Tax=Salmonella phage 36 TaxID=1654889 RepID=A0A0N7CE39_9CAUD|nr:Rz-like spanin [Salmonella phage 36]AKJ74055.1 putative bdr repeat protein [Salmonella phage 36]